MWVYFDASVLIKRYSKGEDLVFLTSDKRLARAAQSEGLTVFNPEEGTIEQLYGLLGIPR